MEVRHGWTDWFWESIPVLLMLLTQVFGLEEKLFFKKKIIHFIFSLEDVRYYMRWRMHTHTHTCAVQQENQVKRLGEIEWNWEWRGNYDRVACVSSKLWVQSCVGFDCNSVKKTSKKKWFNKSRKCWHPCFMTADLK